MFKPVKVFAGFWCDNHITWCTIDCDDLPYFWCWWVHCTAPVPDIVHRLSSYNTSLYC